METDRQEDDGKQTGIFRFIPEKYLYVIGVVCCTLHAFSRSTSTSLTKLSTLSAPMLAIYNAVLVSIASLILAIQAKASLFGERSDRVWLAIRAVGSIGYIASMYSIKFIPVTETTAIQLSSPIFGMILARFVLKEPFGLYEGVMLILTVIGTLLVINPVTILASLESKVTVFDHIIGCSLAFFNSICLATMILIFRKLKHLHYSVLMFWGGVSTTVMCSFVIAVTDSFTLPCSLEDGFISVGSGVTGGLALLFLTLASRYCTVGQTMIVKSVEVIFAAVYQISVFKETIVLSTVFGSVLICLSVIFISIKKKLSHQLKKITCQVSE